jgi:hypothetical protein
MTNNNNGEYLGRILKQRRVMIPLTPTGTGDHIWYVPISLESHREGGEVPFGLNPAKNR